ncbi:MAG TPA: signal peptidase I [Terriglobales bacterium]|jgi:signal peptidase I|nr:signal peptidase I [Terriglobales bacterium]
MSDTSLPPPGNAPESQKPAGAQPEFLHGADRFAPDIAEGTTQTRASAPLPGRQPRHEGWMSLLQSLLVIIVIALFVVTFVTQAFQIPSGSMESTLLIGDYVMVDKVHFGQGGLWHGILPYSPIRRGDIIVFRYPINPSQHFVKRVIGLPGDRLHLKDGKLYVNGQLQDEPFAIHDENSILPYRDNFPDITPSVMDGVLPPWRTTLAAHLRNGELVVPPGSYFAMGDNRDTSYDSRYWGFVPQENIEGRPWLIYLSIAGSPVGTEEAQAADGKLAGLMFTFRHLWEYVRWNRIMRLVK